MSKAPIVVTLNNVDEVEWNPSTKNYISKEDYVNKAAPSTQYYPTTDLKRWNDNPKIKRSHNCYAYALNNIKYAIKDRPQPGTFAKYEKSNNSSYDCKEFVKKIKKDVPDSYITTFLKPCKKGMHKIFLAFDNSEEKDYHFYRFDKTSGIYSLVSHKPGRTSAKTTDASGKNIINPLIADRNYGPDGYNYSEPCAFICVNPKLSKMMSK